MRFMLCALALTIGISSVSRSEQREQDDIIATILHIHELDLQAHLQGDAADPESRLSDHIVVVSEGNITTESKEDMYQRFADYFQKAKHSAWEDIETPLIRVAPGGTMVWGAFNVRSKYVETSADGGPKAVEAVMSWLCTYEKQKGHWVMTSVATTYPSDKP